MSAREGTEVIYLGGQYSTADRGSRGIVLVDLGAHLHVQWRTGAARNEVHLVDADEVESVTTHDRNTVEASLVDSLWTTDHHTVGSVPALYAEAGADGVISGMADLGVLDGLSGVVEDALARVSSEVRQVVSALGGGLDEEAQEDVTQRLTTSLVGQTLSLVEVRDD